MSSAAASSSSDYTYPACIREAIAWIEKIARADERPEIDTKMTRFIEQHQKEAEFNTTVMQFCREYGALVDTAVRCKDLHTAVLLLTDILSHTEFFAWTPFELNSVTSSMSTFKPTPIMKCLFILMAVPFHPDPVKSAGLLQGFAALLESGDDLTSAGYWFLTSAIIKQYARSEDMRPWPAALVADRRAKMELVFAPDSIFKSDFNSPSIKWSQLSRMITSPDNPNADLVVAAMKRDGAMSRELLIEIASSEYDRAHGNAFRSILIFKRKQPASDDTDDADARGAPRIKTMMARMKLNRW